MQKDDGNRTPQIREFIQAGYPCLFMRTVETPVAEREIKKALVELNMDRVRHWLACGAQPSETVNSLLKKATSPTPVTVS